MKKDLAIKLSLYCKIMAISQVQNNFGQKKIRASHPALMKAGQNAHKLKKTGLRWQNYGYQSGPKKFWPKKKSGHPTLL